MPQPTLTDVHVNAPLTNMSIAYLQNPNDYIADKVFPVLPVPKSSNIYFLYDRGRWFVDEAAVRVDGEESAGTGYSLSQATYSCKVYALHKDVGPQVRAQSDTPLDADRDATIFLTQRLAISRERQFVSNYFKTGIWTGSTTGTDITPGTKWDAANSTPIEDIEAQSFNVKKLTGFFPNRFVLGTNTYKALKNHDEFLQRIKYTERGVVTPDIMASVLAPPNQPESPQNGFKVFVASAIYNSAKEGQADSMNWAATNTDALLSYATDAPGIQQPSAGYIFTWTPIAGYTATIKRIAAPLLGSGTDGQPTIRVEAEMSFDMKLVASDLAAYFSASVS
jgi:hypothetical protein